MIELLVVVTIILSLLAIMQPALRRGMETARIAACAANQRQLAIAVIGYATDNGWVVPVGYVSNKLRVGNYYLYHNNGPVCMLGLLYTSRMVTDSHLYYCPAVTDADLPSTYTYSRPDFGPNGQLSGGHTVDPTDTAVRSTYAARPAVMWDDNKFLILDGAGALPDDEFIGKFPRMQPLAGRSIFSCAYPRYTAGVAPHLDNGTNVAFMDGSVVFKPGSSRYASQTLTDLLVQIKTVNSDSSANPLVTQLFEIFDQRPAIGH